MILTLHKQRYHQHYNPFKLTTIQPSTNSPQLHNSTTPQLHKPNSPTHQLAHPINNTPHPIINNNPSLAPPTPTKHSKHSYFCQLFNTTFFVISTPPTISHQVPITINQTLLDKIDPVLFGPSPYHSRSPVQKHQHSH